MMRAFPIAVCAVLFAMASSSVQAGDAGFTGAAVSFGIDAAHNKVDYGGYVGNQSSSASSTGAKLDASYGWNISSGWVVSLGAAYELGHSDFGSIRYLDGGSLIDVNAKLKDHYSVYVAPGFRLAPQWLIYGQLAWHGAKAETADSRYGSDTTNHHGTGLGFGVAHALSSSLELRAEVRHVTFNRQNLRLSNGRPERTEATVYLGYRF